MTTSNINYGYRSNLELQIDHFDAAVNNQDYSEIVSKIIGGDNFALFLQIHVCHKFIPKHGISQITFINIVVR